MRRLDPHTLGFTLLLGALVTLSAFATDMGLPVLAATAASLGVAPATAALTLSVFLFGFSFGPLVAGPVSDRIGRRPVLLTGCAAFAVFGALAAFAQTLNMLLAWRFLMGAGAGCCQVLVLAVVRDLFTGQEARVKQSYVNLAGGVAPIIAPSLGAAVAALGGWRAIYGVLAVGATVLFSIASLRLGESAPRRRGMVGVRYVLADYARVVRHPVSIGYAFVLALSFACLFAYVSGSSLVLIGLFGVSRRAYGLLFASTAFGLMIGAFTSARLNRRGVPHARLLAIGLATVAGTALVLVILDATGVLRAWSLVALVVVSHIGQGVLRPNAAHGMLDPLPDIVGVASAVLSALQMLAAALAGTVVAALFNGRTALAMSGTMAVCAIAAAAVFAGIVRPAERRLAAAREPAPPLSPRPAAAAS